MHDAPTETRSDIELLRAFQRGDAEAFTALMHRYEARLRRHTCARLAKRLRRRVSVADVHQEVMWAAFRGMKTLELRSEHAFGPWLMQVADGKVAEAARRFDGTEKRSVRREESAHGDASERDLAHDDPSPSQDAIGKEDGDRVRRALAELSPDHRAILILARMRGLSLAEAGACMGRSREAAKKLYGRALSALAEKLASPRGAGA